MATTTDSDGKYQFGSVVNMLPDQKKKDKLTLILVFYNSIG
jgi:hypothetical protein